MSPTRLLLLLLIVAVISKSYSANKRSLKQSVNSIASSGYMLDNTDIYTDGKTFVEPRKLSSSDGVLNVELHVKAYTVVNDLFSYQTRAYCYNSECSMPGPTLYVKPGDQLIVKLVNDLSGDSDSTMIMNRMHSPDIINLHTHGLHIAPDVDNVFIDILPDGDSYTYTYDIGSDHGAGNHWYHSHLHGTSAFHVMGGLVGAIIVEPNSIDDLPEALRTMTRKVMVFTHMQPQANVGQTENTDPFTCFSFTSLSTLVGNKLSINPVYYRQDTSGDDIRDAWFVNGQYQPKLTMTNKEYQIFDMVCASGDRILELQLRTAVGISAGENAVDAGHCKMYLLAYDGAYLDEARSASEYTYVKHLPMLQGQRASVAVKCSKAGKYYFQTVGSTTESPSKSIADLELKSSQNLITITVTSSNDAEASDPSSLSSIPKPSYYKSLVDEVISDENKWSMSIEQTGCCGTDKNANYWIGIGDDCELECFGRDDCLKLYGSESGWNIQDKSPNCDYESFPGEIGSSSSSNYRHTAVVGVPQELSLWGRGKAAHPMHIHVNHFSIAQVVVANGTSHVAPGTRYRPRPRPSSAAREYGEIGDIRDTWPSLPGESIIRYNASDFSGEVVLHCHFLKHEDLGMMATFLIEPIPDTPTGVPVGLPTTYSPTASTKKPTSSPSHTQTQPSNVPSNKPSQPSELPTVLPTACPSVIPTSKPTTYPTLPPISGSKNEIVITSSQTLTNVDAADIEDDAVFYAVFERLIIDALSDESISVSEVKVTGVAGSSLSASALSRLVNIIHGRVLVVNRATVTYDIVTILENTLYSTSDALSTALSTALVSSENSLVASLQASDITAVKSVTSMSAPVLEVSSELVITDDDGGKSTAFKTVYIIIIAAGGGGIIIFIAVYVCFCRSNKSDVSGKSAATDKIEMHNRNANMNISSGEVKNKNGGYINGKGNYNKGKTNEIEAVGNVHYTL